MRERVGGCVCVCVYDVVKIVGGADLMVSADN